jgi:hypothetical protein
MGNSHFGTVVAKVAFQIGDFTIMTKAGAPEATDGVDVAGIGSICSDTTNGALYVNAGTKAEPSWKKVTQAA